MAQIAQQLRQQHKRKAAWDNHRNKVNHDGLHHPSGKFLRHAIFGMNDGLVSTLAFVAGFVGAAMQQQVILIGGFILMISGAISMALGTYISTKSQLEFYTMEIMRERRDIEAMPDIERDHVRDIYKKRGFSGKELDRVVKQLTKDKTIWLDVLIEEELGMNKHNVDSPIIASFVMFFAFIVGSFVPLSAYFVFSLENALGVAVIASLSLLFITGMGKTYFTGRSWLKSGVEMMLVASVATFVSYYFGQYLANILAVLA